ncbi:MAG: hypothetical protein CUN54_03970 [Phototrophicales bacterium]|nr:MAG: hypothetical protein CUN54_03970 [Phototrophicales bacterium]
MRNLLYSAHWRMVVILLIAFAGRLYRLQSQSIWFDEGWSAFAAVQPTLRDAITADPTNPPLYYTLLNISTSGFGDSVFALRIISVFLGLLVIPLSYQLAHRLFGKSTGLYAALLATFSPLLLWASQEARMYSLLAVLTLVAAIAWHQLINREYLLAWIILWSSELALLYAHNTGPVIVLWLNMVTFLFWIHRHSPHHPSWRLWMVGQIAVGLFWSPWFITRFLDLQQANSTVNSPPQINFALFSRIWQAFWTGPWEMVGHVDTIVALSGIALVIAVIIIPWRQATIRWLMLHVGISIFGLLLGLTILGNEMHGRYQVMITPFLLVAIGAGIARTRLVQFRLVILGLFGLIFFVSLQAAQNPLYGHDDTRAIVDYYRASLNADDTVLAWSYADRYELAYYWDRMNVTANRVTLPEGADFDTIQPLLPESGRVALNVWYTQRADFRGMMSCILGHGTRNVPEKFVTYGMENQLYDADRSPLAERHSAEFTFLDGFTTIAQVTAITEFPVSTADRAVCVPVEIRTLTTLDVDLKAVVIVRNHLHQEIARADAVFAQADQRTSSQVVVGSMLTAFPLLRLPYGTPPGEYDVVMRIYDETRMPSGYDVLSADGTQRTKDLLLGQWHVVPGASWSTTNRETDLPSAVDLLVNDSLRLIAHNMTQETTQSVNGGMINPAFLWRGDGALPELLLQAEDESWQIIIPPSIDSPHDDVTLDWRNAQIPLDAPAGDAFVKLPNGAIIARYHIEELPAIYERPDVDLLLDDVIPGVGTLEGLRIHEESFRLETPLEVTLLWRADETPDESYTVFAQLLNQDGILIAQSDSIPAQGTRPTTGWRRGEYIIDTHQLRFNDNAAPGPATLIVGMYESISGTRVILDESGTDFLSLPVQIEIR